MPSLVPMKIFNKYTIESLKLFIIIFNQLFGLLNWNSTVFLLQNKSFFFSSFGSWNDWKSNEIFLSTVMCYITNFGHYSDSKYHFIVEGAIFQNNSLVLNARWWHACQVVSDEICSKFIESNLCLCYCLLLSTQSY